MKSYPSQTLASEGVNESGAPEEGVQTSPHRGAKHSRAAGHGAHLNEEGARLGVISGCGGFIHTFSDEGPSVQQRVEVALAALRAGRPVLLQDDEDRENEADLIVAASLLTEQTMALLIRECSGIVCLCLTPAHAQHLELRPMVEHNRSRYGTAFTVSIEARTGVGTGVSALDRLRTVQAATAPDAQADDIVSPGHVFPLVAAEGGVLARRGHTEGAVDLARLAGLPPAAVLCELMNADGTLAKGDAVQRFSALHDLPILSIEDLVSYRSDQHALLTVV